MKSKYLNAWFNKSKVYYKNSANNYKSVINSQKCLLRCFPIFLEQFKRGGFCGSVHATNFTRNLVHLGAYRFGDSRFKSPLNWLDHVAASKQLVSLSTQQVPPAIDASSQTSALYSFVTAEACDSFASRKPMAPRTVFFLACYFTATMQKIATFPSWKWFLRWPWQRRKGKTVSDGKRVSSEPTRWPTGYGRHVSFSLVWFRFHWRRLIKHAEFHWYIFLYEARETISYVTD